MTKEQDIENALIQKLQGLKYKYRDDIRDRKSLEDNFRHHFERLNQVKLEDTEFTRLLDQIVTPDVFKASETLRKRHDFERNDGTPLYFTLVNTKDWCKNEFEVINQLRMNTDYSHHRYDVILLMNGIPVVQIELKSLDISPRRAMQQIVEYKNDIGNGYAKTIMCFIQMFMVSNGNQTQYFANNRNEHFTFDAEERFLPMYQFADAENQKITRIDPFADAFLSKCKLAEMISRYMVLVASEQKILMMRPYQIYAVKNIIKCIDDNNGNGYIWHTTGSGKTLTSFKASTLLKDNDNIDKCLFVVDRKDLDRQTRDEFNRFQKDCVEENTNTNTLVERLESQDHDDKVIVTTIQKLGLALTDGAGVSKHNPKSYKERLEDLSHKRVVFIFDECHRSQFGENHQSIKEFFPHAQMFGFTGTPIFEENSTQKTVTGEVETFKTTDKLFDKSLHEYTITNAIEDGNVLKFNVDYFGVDPEDKQATGKKPSKHAIVESILDKHQQSTDNRRFNAIFATKSINDAIEYYNIFKDTQTQMQSDDPNFKPLNIACVFSPPSEGNKDIKQLSEDLPQELYDNKINPEEKKQALKTIIDDYNQKYGGNHSISEFDTYYQDVQKRIKDQQWPNVDYPHRHKIDIIIVVDMLLTGFDSKYLNTLYVDKNLKHHGLIQAFSRTNRVLNDTKPYGHIIDYRQQMEKVDEAIRMFSGGNKNEATKIWLVQPPKAVIAELKTATEQLSQFMENNGVADTPDAVHNLKGDIAKAGFLKRFAEVQSLKTRLDQYTDLTEENKQSIEEIIPTDTLKGFKGAYLETAKILQAKRRQLGANDEPIPPEINDAQMELVLFASAEIDYDYIMNLIADYTQKPADKAKMTIDQLAEIIKSDAKFMEDGDDIIEYLKTLAPDTGRSIDEIRDGYDKFKQNRHNNAITEIANDNGLEPDTLKAFVNDILYRRVFHDSDLTELLSPLGLGWKERTQKKLALMEDLSPLLRKMADGKEIAGLNIYD